MSAYHLEDDGDLLRVYRVMDGHKVCVAVEAHTWRQGSEWTGAWLDADGTANELRHLVNCATACEGMDDPAAEIARLRGIESHVSNGGTWVPIAQLREALDALEADFNGVPPEDAVCHVGICPQSKCGNCQRQIRKRDVLRKHGRKV